jgi:hypothetical protein
VMAHVTEPVSASVVRRAGGRADARADHPHRVRGLGRAQLAVGTLAWSFVAGAFYFTSPTVGAVAASRTLAPINVLRIVALIIFAILVWDVITFTQQPTHPGAYMGGAFIGVLLPVGGALAWYIPSRIALGFDAPRGPLARLHHQRLAHSGAVVCGPRLGRGGLARRGHQYSPGA